MRYTKKLAAFLACALCKCASREAYTANTPATKAEEQRHTSLVVTPKFAARVSEILNNSDRIFSVDVTSSGNRQQVSVVFRVQTGSQPTLKKRKLSKALGDQILAAFEETKGAGSEPQRGEELSHEDANNGTK